MPDTTDQWEEQVCNRRLINEVAEEQQVKPSLVDDMLQHYSRFIARTIRAGAMEGVFVPYLGKFQVKPETQQHKELLHALHPVFRQLIQTDVSYRDLLELIKPPSP